MAIRSVLAGTAGLTIAACVALALTLVRPPMAGQAVARVRRVAIAATLVHVVHFSEEWLTGFATRFPQLLGLAPWPPYFFEGFNLACLLTWALAIVGLGHQPRLAAWPLWFLALASVANGLAHPVLALAAGDYFPGLWTSPLCAAAGIALLLALARATRR